jgi:RNA polymerase sigma-70 factor (ECF subfamily)
MLEHAEIRRLFDEGRRAWPGIDLPLPVFAEHLAGNAGSREGDAGEADPPPPEGTHAADLYLASACAARVRGAVDAFEHAHIRSVDRYLARMQPSAAFVDEVRQVVREKLFVGKDGAPPKIAEYAGQGALAGWVRVVAIRAALDLNKRDAAAEEPARTLDEPVTGDPEIDYVKQRYRQAFNDALRDAVAALPREQRELLRVHFIEGRTLEELAAEAGVHRATIARRLAAAREAAAGEALRLLRARLDVSEAELASLAGILRSQLHLSLAALRAE